MDVKELREKDVPALNETLMALLNFFFGLRMKHSSAELSNISELGKTKRLIARVKTIIREKQA